VIPTRNEADNVERLIEGICDALPGPNKELVFVDDSDDDTPARLQRLLAHSDCPGLVMQRSNSNRAGGLSTAVVRGFAASSGPYVCTMDADLQHPASAVPLLYRTARATGVDIVVGSRFTTGGSARGFGGAGRQLISASARALARAAIAPARQTTDPLSGFFMVRRHVFEGVELRPVGYKILLEILVRGRWAQLIDVPYAFHSRNAGVSKATLFEGMKFVRHLAQLLPASRRNSYGRSREPVKLRGNGRSPRLPEYLLKDDFDWPVVLDARGREAAANGHARAKKRETHARR
jgi:glycosyltransferase involved in cell wall biosynthesis